MIAGFTFLQIAIMWLVPLMIVGFAITQEEIETPEERRHADG